MNIRKLFLRLERAEGEEDVSFQELPVGHAFIDKFDAGDAWVKINQHQARVLIGREFGPNDGEEGSVHDIKPSWTVEPTTRLGVPKNVGPEDRLSST